MAWGGLVGVGWSVGSVVVGGCKFEVYVCQGSHGAVPLLEVDGVEAFDWTSIKLAEIAMRISSSMRSSSTDCVAGGARACGDMTVCGGDAAFSGGVRGNGGGAFGRGGGSVVAVCVASQLSFEDIAGVLAQTGLTRASPLEDFADTHSDARSSKVSRCTASGTIVSSGAM